MASSAKLMGFDEYMEMVADLDLVDQSFTMREAKLAFVWSRMRTIDELSERTRAKLHNLSQEDFYEILVRISSMKAWPTDDEVADAGFKDAGQFLLDLQEQSRQVNILFVNSRSEVGAEHQPIWRKLEHLITLILRIIERRGNASGADMKLTKKEVREFVHRDKSQGR